MLPTTKVKVLIITGSIIVVVCVVFAASFGAIFNAILNNALVIDEGKPVFDQFTSPDTPIYMDFHFFNVTNPVEVQRYGVKPILQEIGPYVYDESYTKFDFAFDYPAGTVDYYQNTTYHFNREKSIGSEDDQITTLNAVMVILGSRIDKLSPGLKAIGELLFLRFNLKNQLFVTRKVSELLFKGYYDPFVDLMGQITGDKSNSGGRFGFYLHLVGALGYDSKIVREIIWPEIESGMDLFQTFTVKELLFEGWDLSTYNFDFSYIPRLNFTAGLSGTLYEILAHLGIDVPFLEPNKIGLFYGSNNTNDGLYKVSTGAKGMDQYLYIREWLNSTKLEYWDDQYCDMINGTDGTQFPPGVSKNDVIRLYTSDLCRSLLLEYERDQNVFAVSAYHYIPPEWMLQSPTLNPDNMCYCVKVPGDTECLGSSMMNMAPCSEGAPIVLSTPHFYQGDGDEIEKFVGLNPEKEKHETFLDIEPISGVVMKASKRIQLNLPLRRYGNLPSFQNVPEAIFPILWADENAEISEADAKKFNKVLTLPFIIVYSLCGVLIFLGLVLIVIGVVKHKKIKKEPQFKAIIKK